MRGNHARNINYYNIQIVDSNRVRYNFYGDYVSDILLTLASKLCFIVNHTNPWYQLINYFVGIIKGEIWFATRPALCSAIGSVCWVSCFCSLLSIMVISIDRYVHICKSQVCRNLLLRDYIETTEQTYVWFNSWYWLHRQSFLLELKTF